MPLIAAGALFLATVAVIVTGLHAHTRGGLPAVNAVAFAITIVWAITGVDGARGRCEAPDQPVAGNLLVAFDALVAAGGARRRTTRGLA